MDINVKYHKATPLKTLYAISGLLRVIETEILQRTRPRVDAPLLATPWTTEVKKIKHFLTSL
jgi:hypothetical protein